MNILSRTKLFLGTSEAYLPILKAGYVLIAAALVAVSQFGPELIKQENETFKGMYEIEYTAKKPISTIDCSTVGAQEPTCRLVQHQLKTHKTALDLWSGFIGGCAKGGITLLFLGLLGWLMPLFGLPTAKKTHAASRIDA
jgi:hypothetical protein